MKRNPNRGLARVAKKSMTPSVAAKVTKVTGGNRVKRSFSQPGAVKSKHGIKTTIPEMTN